MPRSTNPVSLVVSIDTECDKGPAWRVRRPLSFENVVDGIPSRLQRVFDAYDIKATYLLSPEVLKHEESVAVMKGLGGRAEIGTHLHSEFIDPSGEPDCVQTQSFLGDYPANIQYEKLKNLTELFIARFGTRPTSFRAGRFGLSPLTLRFLEQLGYLVDSSVTPYMWWWRSRGVGVNYLGAPAQPYHPAVNDFRKPGSMTILEVPVTLSNPFWERWPAEWLRRIDPINRWQTVAINALFKRRLKCAWLRPTYSSAAQMLTLVDRLVDATRMDNEPPVLCMMFHSNEATAGMSPYHASDADVAGFLNELSGFLDGLRQRYVLKSVGLTDLADHGGPPVNDQCQQAT